MLRIISLAFGQGKNLMIVGGITFLIGVIIFMVYPQMKDAYDEQGYHNVILYYMVENFGRFGMSGFFVLGGILEMLLGAVRMKRENN